MNTFSILVPFYSKCTLYNIVKNGENYFNSNSINNTIIYILTKFIMTRCRSNLLLSNHHIRSSSQTKLIQMSEIIDDNSAKLLTVKKRIYFLDGVPSYTELRFIQLSVVAVVTCRRMSGSAGRFIP